MQVKILLTTVLLFSSAYSFEKAPLSFDYLDCGEYAIKGKLLSENIEKKQKYYLHIYPPKKGFTYNKSRKIEIRQLPGRDQLEGLDNLNISLKANFLKDSHTNSYIVLSKVIGPTTWSGLHNPIKVITKIKINKCK
jgi:hypothetical protein